MSNLLPGFTKADGEPKARLVVAVDGLDKSGKNNFAFSAPGPIAYLPFDVGAEGVIEKFQNKKDIYVPKVSYESRFENGAAKAEATQEFARFSGDLTRALKAMRTTIVDTGSEAWELLRLAEFGKLTQIKPHHYTTANQKYRDLITQALDPNLDFSCNLILLHKLKETWTEPNAEGKSKKTGLYERAGFGETGYCVQINVLCYRLEPEERAEKDLGFRMRITNCRQNPEIQGMVLENEMINFQTLGALAMPELDPAVWE